MPKQKHTPPATLLRARKKHIVLHSAEVVSLEQFSRSPNIAMRDRAQTVLARFEQGFTEEQIALFLRKHASTVRQYLADFRKHRLASLCSLHFGNENAAKLTREEKQSLEAVLAEPPSAYGLPSEFWSVPSVRQYTNVHLGMTYESSESCRALLKFCGFSFHRPAKLDIKRDETAITKRMEAIRKEIQPYLADPDCLVFASDEVRLQEGCITREAWLKKGQKTVIKEHRSHTAQSYIGFLNLRSYDVSLKELTWQNNETITQALVSLAQDYPDKRLVVIWDGAPSHRGPLLREALTAGHELQNLHLISMPAYAPDHNPIERVWGQAKASLKNTVFGSFNDMKAAFAAFITSRAFPNLSL
jgi:transposase